MTYDPYDVLPKGGGKISTQGTGDNSHTATHTGPDVLALQADIRALEAENGRLQAELQRLRGLCSKIPPLGGKPEEWKIPW